MRFTKGRIAIALASAFIVGGAAGRLTRLSQLRASTANSSRAVPVKPAPPEKRSVEVALSIYDARIGAGWQDWGWGRHDLATVGPARVVFGGYAGIVFFHEELTSHFGGVTFRYKAPWPPFLAVSLKHTQRDDAEFPHVDVKNEDLVDVGDGWHEAWIAWSRLNPKSLPIDRVVISAARQVGADWVSLDKIALTKADGQGNAAPVRDAELTISCDQPATRISPLIYGVSMNAWGSGATAHRIGGNPTSRLNWELGAVWNAGRDWFFENAAGKGSMAEWVNEATAHHAQSAVSVPMLGWVAKDATSVGFPISKLGKQRGHDPYREDAGNGLAPDGTKLRPGSPTLTSVPAPPEKISKWISALRDRDRAGGSRGIAMYILDNEPSLWSETHRDVHPEPVSQDELLDRTLRYAAAIRAADPDPLIAGPAEWGWTGYFFSAQDREAGVGLRPDRRAHGDAPLIAWYLRALAQHEKTSGVRLLDALDLHFYPQAERIFGVNARTDPEGSALRLRSTRALWDPEYVDESWIKEPIRLIPRMHEWIAANYPGVKTSIGEWSFGADDHMSGALATAEALGRFGQQGLDSAFYWDGPKPSSRAFWAFRAFRDFDGVSGHFLDWSVPTIQAKNLSIFASRDDAGTHLVVVIVNLDPTFAFRTRVKTDACGKLASRRSFTYTGDPKGILAEPLAQMTPEIFELIPPYSIRVLDVFVTKAP